jgi:hypothetical protein
MKVKWNWKTYKAKMRNLKEKINLSKPRSISHVELSGFFAKHYDALLDFASIGFYRIFIKDVISKMGVQPHD